MATQPQSWTEVTHLFEAALELLPDERDAFLEGACAGDAELRREVQSLLDADAQAGEFMEIPGCEQATPTSGAMVPSVDDASVPSVDAPEEYLKKGSSLGRYLVRERLGVGGMGAVYLANDPELNRKIAIKLMRSGASGNISASEGRARLMREAQAMALLSHPNVIAVYDVGTFGDEVFIAMEYVEGSTLTDWLAEQGRPWREIVNMVAQTGRGLAAAHAAGILHRDFKPDNVLVGKDGRPRVLDFGLARALFGEPEKRASDDEPARADATSASNLALLGAALTQPGRLMGTPVYMAPEQLMGQGADHKTDQYSFCVALYQGLYGELPFKGQSIETLVREMSQGKPSEVATSSQVPSRLRRAVLRGLRPEPADRYPSMDALLEELELAVQSTRTRRRFLALAVLAMVGAVAAAGAIVWKKGNPVQPSVRSVAILPLRNLGDPSDEATVDGLTDGLTTTVAQLSSATVISQNSSARYKTSPKSLQAIGSELNVDTVVSGSAKRSGSRIQIGAQLTSVATGRQLWTRNFESEYGQLPILQADIAAGLLAEVESRRITPEQKARLEKLRSLKPEVYEACLRGWLLEKRAVPDLQKSIAYFQEAIREDPNYAPAYVGLGNGYMKLGFQLSRGEDFRLATEALMKALSLDPKLGEAHAALSFVKMYLWDWRAAGEEAKRAIELSPNDALAHWRYSFYLIKMQRLDEALVEAKRAQRSDPLSIYGQQAMWRWFLATKQYDRAIEEMGKGIELEPNRPFSYGALAITYHDAGRYAEALAVYQKAYERFGALSYRALVAHMLVHLGKTGEAEKIIEELKDDAKNTATSYWIATTYSVLKRKEETFKWLEYAYEARAQFLIGMTREEEDLAWLRSDPRFQDLVKRVGWPQ